MSTREHRSGRQSEGDPSQGQHGMSQGSTVIENDNIPTIQGPNPTDEVSLLDQTIATSVTDVEPSTILVPSKPPMPTFTTVKPKQEKVKGTVCVAASAKVNNRALTYIKSANENNVMLQNGIHTERSYSDSLLAEGKNHISSMQKTIKIFHGKIEGGLKSLAKAEKKLTETKAKHKYVIESLKLEVASLKKELTKSNTERDMYKAKADKAMQANVVEKPAPNKPSQLELAREKSRLRIEEKRALMSHNSKIKKDEMEHNHNIRKKRLSTISGGIFSVDNSGAFYRKGKSQRNIRRQAAVIVIIYPLRLPLIQTLT
eukprot:CCRYP_017508-RB/>CCRYP_017508-RB protein AED:0.04 eAED:0.04 QI:194/1/1/1/0.5/0.66/3/445/314